MKLAPGAARVLVVLALGALAVAASARPPLPWTPRAVVIVAVAFVAAWAARSSLLLLAARKGLLVVDASAPVHRLSLATLPAALLASVAVAPLVLVPDAWTHTPILVAGLTGIAVGALLSRRDARPRAPRRASLAGWLLVDTALPAALLAALVGVSVAFLRLHGAEEVTPHALGRHLGGTVFLYALLLGLGGVSKAFGERKAGLVLVDDVRVKAPGPITVGGLMGLGFLFAVPALAPPLPLETVLVVKGAVGFAAGGLVSLLGALQGCRLSSRGPKED